MLSLKHFILSSLLVVYPVENARILCAFFIPSVSHQVVYQPIWKELSLRGHQVTVITPNPINDPNLTNLTEIDISVGYDILNKFDVIQEINKEVAPWKMILKIIEIIYNIGDAELSQPQVLELIADKKQQFDVLMVDMMLPAVYAFQTIFNCPMIAISSAGTITVGHDTMANPTHPVLYPDITFPLMKIELNFFDRVLSTLYEMLSRLFWNYIGIPKHDTLVKKYFGESAPSLRVLQKNFSLLFLNTNPIVHAKRPNVPAVIEYGNVHIKSKKPLPEDLKKDFDEAKEGVVYFSLGSNVKSSSLTEDKRNIIIEALAQLPYKVFWKWETDHLPGRPKNVFIRKWFPQNDLLGHPNVKVFVTQGGLQSMDEAIANKVPMVVLPFIGDQPLNAMKIVHLGMGQSVDPYKMNAAELTKAILEVAHNKSYTTRIAEIAALTADTPMNGLDKVVWWTEYVIRHKGARHLRSPALDIPWYKYYLIDVILFVFISVVLSTLIIFKIVKSLVYMLCKSKTTPKNKTD